MRNIRPYMLKWLEKNFNDKVQSKVKNIFNKEEATLKTMNASTSTLLGTGTYSSSSVQKHLYIECKPDTWYIVKKISNINDALYCYATEDAPDIDVDYTVLYASTVLPYCLIKTTENAKYLDIRLNVVSTSEEDLNKIIDSIQIYDFDEILSLKGGE